MNEYQDDFCRGKNALNIEDIWQTACVSSYWRNGPVLNNALSGLDQALRGRPVDRGFESFFGIRASTDIPPYFYIRDTHAVVAPTDEIAARNSVMVRSGPTKTRSGLATIHREGFAE